jgi:hypothetical protein
MLVVDISYPLSDFNFQVTPCDHSLLPFCHYFPISLPLIIVVATHPLFMPIPLTIHANTATLPTIFIALNHLKLSFRATNSITRVPVGEGGARFNVF